MKRLIILFPVLLLLVACGENEYEKELRESKERLEKAQENLKRVEETTKQIDKTTELIEETQKEMGIESNTNVDELNEVETKELLEYAALTDGDEIKELTINGGEIKVIIDISTEGLIDDKKILAQVIYESAGDELLQRDGWETLTIEFEGVGEVSMHRNEKHSNEYGDYFPTEEILRQLE